ncbi:dethiobiotin synthase [Sediminibacterium roseum]|uniref:ATP-dependent dethiobiotin synthetase BioD n=1 Tax=Sediminibacterium roseum TaxID=1978412 RepID=A0ABW9ZSS9_9BACT|nr:dethiobiotin synthase [Sediminibacterium roseum]NCI50174.1 dethiobiotin synthase [Sediminibacterium roseum]
MKPIFITGIGTNIGKTLVSALLTEALHADYWKPIQAGYEDGTDATTVAGLISNNESIIHPEVYRLQTPASPHIAARNEQVEISLEAIVSAYTKIKTARPLLIEGAGGLLVPLTGKLFVADLIKALDARVIIVSRNYLGSINHSLLTAAYCKSNGIDVAGWIFNDDYLDYENEIVSWSGYPSLGSVPAMKTVDQQNIRLEAAKLKDISGKLQAFAGV